MLANLLWVLDFRQFLGVQEKIDLNSNRVSNMVRFRIDSHFPKIDFFIKYNLLDIMIFMIFIIFFFKYYYDNLLVCCVCTS